MMVAVNNEGNQSSIYLTLARARPSGTVMEWLRLFSTYAAVCLDRHPDEAPGVLTYVVSILDMQRRYGGFAWRLMMSGSATPGPSHRQRLGTSRTGMLPWIQFTRHRLPPAPWNSSGRPFVTSAAPEGEALALAMPTTTAGAPPRLSFRLRCANCGRRGHARLTCHIPKGGHAGQSRAGHANPGPRA